MEGVRDEMIAVPGLKTTDVIVIIRRSLVPDELLIHGILSGL